MNFPPSDVIQSETMFYRLMGIADEVNEAIADTGLKAEVGHTPNLLQYVRVPLQEGGGVTLAPVSRYPGAWLVLWPSGGVETVTTAWPLETERQVLVDIIAAAVRTGCAGRRLPSPLCWGRTEHGPITELADQLLGLGVDAQDLGVDGLVAMDEEGRPQRDSARLSELRLLDKCDRERTLVITLDERHGWSVDQIMPFPGASGRLNLAAALGLAPSLPRVGPDEVGVEKIATILAEDAFWVDVPDDDQRHLARYGQTPDDGFVCSKESARAAAVAWLVWAGFGDPAARWARIQDLAPAIELFIDFAERQVGLSGVQRYKGIAAVGGRVPVVVAQSSFSKNARDWADAADMLLFSIDEVGVLHPANGRAHACTPQHMGDRPRLCDDPTCGAIGCVLDDEYCPSERGRRSHPDAERWRLF